MLTPGNRRSPLAWALWLVVALALTYVGCSEKPPANKVTEAGETGGNSTTGNGGNGNAGTTGNGGSGTGATGNGGTPSGGGTGGTNPGGAMNGGNAGAGNVGTGGGGGMVMEDDPSCRMGYPPQEDAAFQRYHLLVENDPDAMSKLAAMQPAEKLDILSGGPNCSYNDGTCFQAQGVSRAAVNYPIFKMRDGPRGVRGVVGEKSTTFAVAMARGASWDVELERRIGQVMAVELRALRADLLLAPTINILRHPGWARAQETYGEDPVLIGEMAAAFVRGHQDGPTGMPACPKHFAGNNTDENRGGGPLRGANMVVDEQTLRENYLRHFQIVVEKADPACIMAAYNDLNGTPCAENTHLLTDVLRSAPSSAQKGWGWTGFVVSDWGATMGAGAGSRSITAGLDVEMPTDDAFGDSGMPAAAIDVAARRVMNVRGTFKQLTSAYIQEHGSAQNTGIVNTAAHVQLAQESAEKGAVLLKNSGVLPLGKSVGTIGTPTVQSIVVLGPDRAKPVTDTSRGAHGLGDRGSSGTNPPHTVTYVQGIMAHAGSGMVTDSASASDAAGKTVAIIPVTMAHEDEGENYDSNGAGGDRDTLTLSTVEPRHWTQKPTAFINAVRAADANVKIVVLLAFGSAVVMEDWMGSADAIVQTFYPGQEAGTAVARLLFGDINFSGKLPFTIARDPSHYPTFGNTAQSVTFEYLHGYRRFDSAGTAPRFFFGFGMSYTSYAYSNLRVLCPMGIGASGRLNVEVTVENTGMMAGDEVVQLYVGYPNVTTRMHPSPPKELKTFTKVHLEPGESKVVQLYVPARDLRHWGSDGWQLDPGEHRVYVGPSADPASLQMATFNVN